MITRLYELGMSVSYERTLELEDRLTTALCKRFVSEDAVCPSQMRKGIFTVGALDNIDHNLSSITAQGSFHGTSISLFQFPTITNPGIIRPPFTLQADNSPAPPLPDSYRIVHDVAGNVKYVTVPKVDVPNTVNGHLETAGSGLNVAPDYFHGNHSIKERISHGQLFMHRISHSRTILQE